MKYRITHITEYRFQEDVSLGMNCVCLTPRVTPWQNCSYSRIVPTPQATLSDRRIDYFGNTLNYFSFERGYRTLEIRSSSRVTVRPRTLESLDSSVSWETLVIKPETVNQLNGSQSDRVEMALYSPLIDFDDESLRDYIQVSFVTGQPILLCLQDILKRFKADFDFDSTATTVNTPVSEVFEKKRGVCQDFAHTLIALLRVLKLPTRYVSGYIRTYPPEGKPRLRGTDASHAWVSVYCGELLGWVDIDPTNNCFVSDDHVTVAWGRDYSDIAPVKGVIIGSGLHSLHVSVDMDPEEVIAE